MDPVRIVVVRGDKRYSLCPIHSGPEKALPSLPIFLGTIEELHVKLERTPAGPIIINLAISTTYKGIDRFLERLGFSAIAVAT